ncbi:UNVERIFIED_CONTAM: hypothetical protein Sangu_2800000 [Sesamum angustifolium]|uniref:Uncharacterized protein n=1 Tax=Sesamum angustifolium TaxID=2727405 RepID=A0AAW2IT01_9LAMI
MEATIRNKIEGSSRSSLTYSKPYTPRIDNLKMPMGYQPSKFQQFDANGNPKQHVAHFVETCNNAGIYMHTANCQHGRAYKFSSMGKRPVVDYINKWRNLNLNCKDRLSEAPAIEMCIQGIRWGLHYIPQGILPKYVKELTIRAHDTELSITASGVEGPPVQEPRRIKENKN